MKMDLIYRNKSVERSWIGMRCWFQRSGKRQRPSCRGLDRGRLSGRLQGTKKEMKLVVSENIQ